MLIAIVFEDFPGIGQGISPAWYFAAAMVSAIEATILTAIWFAKNIKKTYKK